MMTRILLALVLTAGVAQADIKTVAEVEPECDVCQSRHKGKLALKEALSKARAKQAAEEERPKGVPPASLRACRNHSHGA